MKTIHFYILIILVASFLSSTATTQAQTKEETIDWLKENLKKSIKLPEGIDEFDKIYFGHLDECGFEVTLIKVGGTNWLLTVPTKGLEINSRGEIRYSYDAVGLRNRKTMDKGYINRTSGFFEIKYSKQKVEQKLKHLATFCTE